MITTIYSIIKSLRTTNILLTLLVAVLIYGAIVMPINPAFRDINSVALFEWLDRAPIEASWWLYASILVLALLVLNTVVCSIESIFKKREGRNWLLTISPQIIHVGFCFALLAHLISAYGSYHKYLYIYKGHWKGLKTGEQLSLKKINYNMTSGFMTDVEAEILYKTRDGQLNQHTISPNNPFFIKGQGIYLKDISLYPIPNASIEISYEPGALWALIGSILFTIGTVILLLLKIRDKSV